MKNILVSVVSGATGAALVSFFFSSSYATNIHEEAKEMLQKGVCQVELSYPQLSAGNRCYDNKVVVGQWNDNLYCSSVTVTCP